MDRFMVRDEREHLTDLAADRLGFLVLSFGLLLIVAYRSFVNGVASWELLGLILVSGVVSGAYRLREGVLTRQAVLVLSAVAIIGLVVAAIVALGARG